MSRIVQVKYVRAGKHHDDRVVKMTVRRGHVFIDAQARQFGAMHDLKFPIPLAAFKSLLHQEPTEWLKLGNQIVVPAEAFFSMAEEAGVLKAAGI